ncbi:MAG: LysM domain-containing protein, partial [Deltaproteobacteria bacterium]
RRTAHRTTPSNGSRRRQHIVAAGETLWSIARHYGVSVENIRGRQLPRHALRAGDVLEIF